MNNQKAKRNIKSMKDFKGNAELEKIKKLHAKDLEIKGLKEITEQLELIDQITSTESLFKKPSKTKDNC